MECQPKVYLSCEDGTVIFGPKTGKKVHIHLRANEIIRLDAFTITDKIVINIVDKNPGADCADCGTGSVMPYAPCGKAKELNSLNKVQYIKGPGVFELLSSAPDGVPYVKITKVTSVSDIEFCSQVEPNYCPSAKISCSGETGYGFLISDERDPEATVEMKPCADDPNQESIFLYPAPGPGRTFKVTDCNGNIFGYGANASNCTQTSTSTEIVISSLPKITVNPITVNPIEIESIPDFKIAKLPKLEISQIPELKIQSLPEVSVKKHVVSSQVHEGKLYYVWSDGTKTTEDLPVAPQEYCASIRITCSGVVGYAYHTADVRDPDATIQIIPCGALPGADSCWIYPEAGPGHTVKIVNDDGDFVGYAANTSKCAPESCCQKMVSMEIADDGSVTAKFSDGTVVTSNPLPSC